MKPLRTAVVGAGHLGRIHARLAAQNNEIELVAVADPVAEARESVAAEAQTQAVENVDEVADDIDAVILASPTSTHHELGCALLERRIHLLIEKPLALNLHQADELVARAKRAGVVLQVGHVERFNPALVAMQSDLRDPKFIQATRLSGYPFRSTDIGVVMDLMIHDIDVVLSLTRSAVRRVDALGISVLGGHEDVTNVRLEFASGCVAQLTASRVSYTAQRQMDVFTARSFAALDFASGTATTVKPREEILRRAFRLDHLTADDRAHLKECLFDDLLVKSTLEPTPINAIAEEQSDFVASVRSGGEPVVPGTAGRDAVAVAEMILDKIASHSWDGDTGGRTGAFAMPALPILDGTRYWDTDQPPLRRAG